MISAMSIIYNCAKSSENIKYLRSMKGLPEEVLWYSKNSDGHSVSKKTFNFLLIVCIKKFKYLLCKNIVSYFLSQVSN